MNEFEKMKVEIMEMEMDIELKKRDLNIKKDLLLEFLLILELIC